MRIKKTYLNLSIKYKLFIFFYLIVFILSALFGTYFYSVSSRQVINNVRVSNSEVINQISSNIDYLQRDTVSISTFMSISDEIQLILSKNAMNNLQTPTNQLSDSNSLKFVLNTIVSKDYIAGMILYDMLGRPIYNEFTDGSSGVYNLNALNSVNIFKNINLKNGQPFWFYIGKDSNTILGTNPNSKIAMGRTIRSLSNAGTIGYVLLFINEDYIKGIYKDNVSSQNESFFILDEYNNIISNRGLAISKDDANNITALTTGASPNEHFFDGRISNKKMLISYSPIATSGWNVYYSVTTDNLVSQTKYMGISTILIILLCMILISPLIILISSNFTAPIKKLLNSMKKFQEGNFNEKVAFKYNDEIGVLGAGYNEMVMKISELINSEYKLQIEEKEAELRALQAQINPHFLYNTLNTIYLKASQSKETEVAEMIFLLSQLFRLTLNTGKDFISVAKEKELMSCYLGLQVKRFKDRLDYSLEIDDKILDYNIPKLILQPFVENAILHGISPKDKGGKITVTGTLISNRLVFDIEDTGIGMSAEIVDNLNSSNFTEVNTKSGGSNYAIRNVIERLQLTYKSDYTFAIDSVLGKGTKIRLSIPVSIE